MILWCCNQFCHIFKSLILAIILQLFDFFLMWLLHSKRNSFLVLSLLFHWNDCWNGSFQLPVWIPIRFSSKLAIKLTILKLFMKCYTKIKWCRWKSTGYNCTALVERHILILFPIIYLSKKPLISMTQKLPRPEHTYCMYLFVNQRMFVNNTSCTNNISLIGLFLRSSGHNFGRISGFEGCYKPNKRLCHSWNYPLHSYVHPWRFQLWYNNFFGL